MAKTIYLFGRHVTIWSLNYWILLVLYAWNIQRVKYRPFYMGCWIKQVAHKLHNPVLIISIQHKTNFLLVCFAVLLFCLAVNRTRKTHFIAMVFLFYFTAVQCVFCVAAQPCGFVVVQWLEVICIIYAAWLISFTVHTFVCTLGRVRTKSGILHFVKR